VEKAVTLPTPDAQYPKPRFLSQQSHISHTPPPHSTAPSSRSIQPPFTPIPPASYEPATEHPAFEARRRAVDFAGNSWDLATGGLKTLTAKRELPPGLERRVGDQLPEEATAQRSLSFALVILACVIVMLVSGGVILVVMAHP